MPWVAFLWDGGPGVEGNVVVEYRYAKNRPERLPGHVTELVRLKVDVIPRATEVIR